MLQKSPVLDPSLRNLSYILRHKEWWPEGFEWDFRFCDSCAIGISRKLWGKDPASLPDDSNLMHPSDDYYETDHYRIFCSLHGKVSLWKRIFSGHKISMSSVTPEQVADQIDEFLARKGR